MLMAVSALLLMALIFALKFFALLVPQANVGERIPLQEVRGVSLYYNGLPYPLNFDQQNATILALNRALAVQQLPSQKLHPTPWSKLVIHRFDKPDLELTSVGILDGGNLAFRIAEWHANGYLREVSDGSLGDILSRSYDR